jgi:pimeloyl-ACP methyl ester carboxylesterase
MPDILHPGKIYHRSIAGMSQMDYIVYIPKEKKDASRIMYSIHGISRNAREHIEGFIPQAERYGSVIIAPLFPKANFPRYQQLGTSVAQQRADMAFNQVLQDAQEWLQIAPAPMHLFGFSGGGQFVHRYAMFYPKRVARMVLAAPGWYSFPDPERKYPYGIKSSRNWPNVTFAMERFLQIPTLVMVGEEDDLRDSDLNKTRAVDSFQGLNRIERAERWTAAARALGRSYDISTDFRLELVPNASHAYLSYLAHPPFADNIFGFFFDERG